MWDTSRSEVGSVLEPTRRLLEPVREVVRRRALVEHGGVVRREADVVEVLGRQQAEVLQGPDLLVAEEAEVAAHAGAVEERRERVPRELGRGREAGEARRQARRRPPPKPGGRPGGAGGGRPAAAPPRGAPRGAAPRRPRGRGGAARRSPRPRATPRGPLPDRRRRARSRWCPRGTGAAR